MSNTICAAGIQSEEDVVAARTLARDVAQYLGFDGNDQTRFATAVSEIARTRISTDTAARSSYFSIAPRAC